MINKMRRMAAEHWISLLLVLTLAYSYFLSPSDAKLYQIVLSPVIAAVLDAAIYRLKTNKWEFPWLGLISGMIIAALLAPGNIIFNIAVPAVAMLLKHIIKFRNRNVFNPAALGLFIATLLGAFASWWAVSALVIPFGIIALYKTGRYYNAAAFIIVYYVIAALMGNVILLDYTMLFFALVMLIEPVTTPAAKKGQIVFGIATALLSAVIAAYIRADFFLASLLIMNLFTYRLNRI